MTLSYGFDQLAFWAVHRLKNLHPETGIQNEVYIPFKGQHLKWAKTGMFSQQEYHQMLHFADLVTDCNKDMRLLDYRMVCKALDHRNHCMVDASSHVIALYPDDGWMDPSDTRRSGTKNCMRYARSVGKPIKRVWF